MTILVRAIITGFGLKLGSEIARRVAERFAADESDDKPKEDDDMMPSDLTTDGPNV